MRKWIWKKLGADSHVLSALAYRAWGIVAGGVMAIAIPAALDPMEQGYYFTFASLLSIQMFFELGLNQVLVQMAGHEMAHLSWKRGEPLSGDSYHFDRLASIVDLLRKWYGLASGLFLLVTALVGFLVLDKSGAVRREVWELPWLVMVGMAAINLYASPFLAVLEGCGQVAQVARLRLVLSIAGYSLTWLGFALGFGLWSVPFVLAVSAVGAMLWLRSGTHILRSLKSVGSVAREYRIDWIREVFPFQWRIALSWVSGYLIYQIFTPIVFVRFGPVQAGRLGLALAMFGALQAVAVSWINAKIPVMTMHVAREERDMLDCVFGMLMRRVLTIAVCSSCAVLLAVVLLQALDFKYVDRLASLPVMACMAVSMSASVAVYGMASYMRAHREEPMLAVSVVSGMLTLVLSLVAVRHSVVLTMALQSAVIVAVSLPWTLRLYAKFRVRAAL